MPSNRWLIEGTFETLSNLRIGNGDTTSRDELEYEDADGWKKVDISAFLTDSEDAAYIPGTTLKGKLRSMADNLDEARREQMFGSTDPEKEGAVGGKVIFFDARTHIEDFVLSDEQTGRLAYWKAGRKTGVSAGVTISRKTRTASDKRLFHQEFVPEGIIFKVRIAGVDLSEAEVKDLLSLLERFGTGQTGATIGASTGDGWGKLRWTLTGLKSLDETGLRGWISTAMQGNADNAGWNILEEVSPDRKAEFIHQARAGLTTAANPSSLSVDVTLRFDSNFLVNDPSKVKKKSKNRNDDESEPNENDELPNHFPLLTRDGKVLLPASSIRGALRSQAEKILRTLGGERAACYPDDKGLRKACDTVYSVSDLDRLCPACKIFGAPGWRSPIELTDFTPQPNGDGIRVDKQEFLAIDRFTGGGADGLKFNATSQFKPTLNGKISMDLGRLGTAGAGGWAIALLIFTLRDLAEGDVRLGFGAAKGFGSLTAKFKDLRVPQWDAIPKIIKDDLHNSRHEIENFSWPALPNDSIKMVLKLWIKRLLETSNESSINKQETNNGLS